MANQQRRETVSVSDLTSNAAEADTGAYENFESLYEMQKEKLVQPINDPREEGTAEINFSYNLSSGSSTKLKEHKDIVELPSKRNHLSECYNNFSDLENDEEKENSIDSTPSRRNRNRTINLEVSCSSINDCLEVSYNSTSLNIKNQEDIDEFFEIYTERIEYHSENILDSRNSTEASTNFKSLTREINRNSIERNINSRPIMSRSIMNISIEDKSINHEEIERKILRILESLLNSKYNHSKRI